MHRPGRRTCPHRTGQTRPSTSLIEPLEPRALLSGSLSTVSQFSNGISEVQAADIDGDGDADLLGRARASDYTLSWVVRWNDGAGHFDTSTTLPAAELYGWVVAVDHDGDGDRDFLAGGVSGASYLIENTGSMTFVAPAVQAGVTLGQARPLDLGAAGGLPQWLVQRDDGSYEVWSFHGGGYNAAAFPSAGGGQIAGVADLDADGDLDVALRTDNAPAGRSDVNFVTNSGGAFTAAPASATAGVGASFRDLNGDNRGDFWWPQGSMLFVSDGAGDGTFAAPRLARLNSTGELSAQPIADLNADGLVDAVVFIDNPDGVSVGVVLQNANGTFERFTSSTRFYFRSAVTDSLGADVDGDGRSELLLTSESAVSSGSGTSVESFVAAATPTGMEFVGRPITGAIVARVSVLPSALGRTIRGVDLYADTNGNGLLDSEDALLGTSSPPGDDGRYTIVSADGSTEPGSVRFFAVATESNGADPDVHGGELAASSAVWTRTFYPEGWRNDTTARERVVLFNPYDQAVSYQLLARYETGVRDGVVAEGTLGPGERRTVFITNPNRPRNARVRKNVGYALELQSERRLSAMFEHFDTLGRTPAQSGFGSLVGEQLTDRASQSWALPEVYKSLDQFVLFYNPNPNNVLVHVTFFGPDGVGIGVDQLLEPFRRGGLSIKGVAGLRRNAGYSVIITTETTEINHGRGIVAALTSYDLAKGAAYTSLAFPTEIAAASDLPIIDVGPDHSTRVAVFNPTSSPRTVDVRIDFNTGAQRLLTITVPAHGRFIVNPNRYAPAAAATARVHTDAAGALFATTYDRALGDSAATIADRQASSWSFAQAFLPSPRGSSGAGLTDFATLGLGNAGVEAAHVSVRYVFDSGRTVTRCLTVAPGSFRAIPLHTRRYITSNGGAFSILVQSDRAVTAALSQWSSGPVWGPAPGARGGWWTLGTALS